MKKLLPLLCLTVAKTAFAASFELGANLSDLVAAGKSATENYQFSDALISAVENCSPYHEDFGKYNPALAFVGAFLGIKPDVDIDIEGYQNGKCSFSVTGKLGQLGKTVYACAVDEKMRNEIVAAMRDKSGEEITDTFETTFTVQGQDGQTTEHKSQTTMTATRFNIVYNKLMQSVCKQTTIPPTEEEKEKFKQEMNSLTPDFLDALQTCSPKKTHRKIMFFAQNAEIKGPKDGKCVLSYEDFTLSLPFETAKTVASWEDFEKLSADTAVSKYDYKKNYTFSGLLLTINGCHNGQCSGGGMKSKETIGAITKETGVGEAKCSETSCSFNFINVVTIGEEKTDYSVVCTVPKTEIKRIVDEYASVIAKQSDGTFTSFIPTDETKDADEKIMYGLQKARFCRFSGRR